MHNEVKKNSGHEGQIYLREGMSELKKGIERLKAGFNYRKTGLETLKPWPGR